jgi:transposase InsO family protein
LELESGMLSGMKTQLANRLGLPHILHVLEQFCAGAMDREQACQSLGVSQANLYKLRTSYLRAKAAGHAEEWVPGMSGGNHAPGWPEEIEGFIRQALAAGYTHAFAASEVERLFGRRLARSQVRHWAIRTGALPPPKPPRLPSHLRRWQRGSVGELWQLDATPFPWFGPGGPSLPLLDMIDDCSRLQVGCALYRHETVPAYLNFLRQAFETYGLPLEIYVDHARAFESNVEDSITRIGQRLKFYDVSLVFANSPEAKGKVERIHQVWQDRLPAYFRLNAITDDTADETINRHVGLLLDHRNHHEQHRELRMTPQTAWDTAIRDGRSKLRPVPKEPWWPFVWASRYKATVASDGCVCFRNERFPTQMPHGSKVVLCDHHDRTISILKKEPSKHELPVVLFTNRPL